MPSIPTRPRETDDDRYSEHELCRAENLRSSGEGAGAHPASKSRGIPFAGCPANRGAFESPPAAPCVADTQMVRPEDLPSRTGPLRVLVRAADPLIRKGRFQCR